MSRTDLISHAAPAKRAIQLDMHEEPNHHRSHMVALWDLAPRFSFDKANLGDARKLILERDFTFAGNRYRITLKPTRFKRPNGVEEDRYLGEKEQIVEEVIRRLACKRDRLTLRSVAVRGKSPTTDQYNVRFAFTLYEVREELKRVKHTLNLLEVNEAITLLNEVRITIQDLDAKGSPLLSASAFPVVSVRREGDDDGETFVEFNPLVADAIMCLSFQQFDYETLMKIRDPIARWLLKRLHVQIATTKQAAQRISATEVQRDSGMSVWTKSRNMHARVSKAVGVLVELGVVEGLEVKDILEGRRKVDVLFAMSATPEFMTKMRGFNRVSGENFRDFARLTNGANPAHGFVEARENDGYYLRTGRAMAAAAK